MKTRISFVLAWLLLAGVAARADAPGALTVAVYDFSDVDKSDGGYGIKVTALVTADLAAQSDLMMVERSDLKKALGERAMGISGLVNSEQAAKIGQLSGAKVLVSGQVIKTGAKHLVIVANIVGTETGRLFAAKVDGSPEKFVDLTADLSRKIAQNIRDHASGFVKETQTHEEYLEHIVEDIKGTNRPSVSVDFRFPSSFVNNTANNEMSVILQKAGFTVVDKDSDQKPDVEITGVASSETESRRNGLFSSRTIIKAKARERRTGNIIALDRQVAEAVDVGNMTSWRSSTARAVDALAEKLLPPLAK